MVIQSSPYSSSLLRRMVCGSLLKASYAQAYIFYIPLINQTPFPQRRKSGWFALFILNKSMLAASDQTLILQVFRLIIL